MGMKTEIQQKIGLGFILLPLFFWLDSDLNLARQGIISFNGLWWFAGVITFLSGLCLLGVRLEKKK